MSAFERRRQWGIVAAVVLFNLALGAAVCGIARTAHADSVPVVVLPSAKRSAEAGAIRPASYAVPEPPKPNAAPRLWPIQAPDLLPLPAPVSVHAKPIVEPRPVSLPKALPLPPAPPLAIPAPVQLARPDFRLQPPESRHNVKSKEPIPSPLVRTPPTPTPGDTPMTLSLRRSALSALLGTGLVAGTIYADAEPPKKDDSAITKKDVDTTNKLLADLKKQLEEIKTKDFADLQTKFADLKTKELAALKTELEQVKAAKKQLLEILEGTDKGDGLLKKLASIESKLGDLAKKVDGLDKKLESTRTALASPIAKEAPKSGTVKLVNLYGADVDIIVNGKGYRLAPNESKSLAIPVGSFTYQLLTGGGGETKRTIKEDEEVLLKVN
jgi:hypothetical protein